jgi:hypothetical protein
MESNILENKSMIKNYYYLIAGILSIIFSFTHGWIGQITVLPIVTAVCKHVGDTSNIEPNL